MYKTRGTTNISVVKDSSVNRTVSYLSTVGDKAEQPKRVARDINLTFSEIINFGKSPQSRDTGAKHVQSFNRQAQLSTYTYSENMYSIKHLNHLDTIPLEDIGSPRKDQGLESTRSMTNHNQQLK